MIEALMFNFTNLNNSYSIQGLEDNILKISYWTRPKGWMDQALFAIFFEKPRSF